jgi:hypothetical protein
VGIGALAVVVQRERAWLLQELANSSVMGDRHTSRSQRRTPESIEEAIAARFGEEMLTACPWKESEAAYKSFAGNRQLIIRTLIVNILLRCCKRCNICGYQVNTADCDTHNVHFAHIDDSTKGTKFKGWPRSTADMFMKSFSRWSEAFDEVQLCYALCADCHGREEKLKRQYHLNKLPEELIQLWTKATPYNHCTW